MQNTRTTSRTMSWFDELADGAQDYLIYARKLLATGSAIASLVPSTRWTGRGMLRGIDFKNTRSVLELGAGTGPVTTELLKVCGENCRCLVVEQDHDFCNLLRDRFVQAEIIEGDALALDRILDQHGISTIDHILCELPLGWLPPEMCDTFLRAVCRRLSPGGSFRQLSHLPGVHLGLYRRYFHSVQTNLVLRNIPPAACYLCEVPRVS
jgi:phospholipid N-methyltransferase